MPGSLRHKRKISTAQAMVEFALALPILLLVMYGLIETGRLAFIYASVVSAARQAARYGSATGDNVAGTPYYDDCEGIRQAAKGLGFIQPFSDSDIQIQYDEGPGTTPHDGCPFDEIGRPINGDRINVTVSTRYSPIVPLVPFGRNMPLASSDWRTLLVGVAVEVDVPPVYMPPGESSVSFVKDAWCNSCSPPGSYYEWTGQPIAYTLTIYNNGGNPLAVDSVTDTLIQGVDCSAAKAYDINNPLPPGSTTHCYGTYTIKSTDAVDNGTVYNAATFTGKDAVTLQTVLGSSNKTINFVPKPQLALRKDANPPEIINVGSIISYTYTLTNTGNVKLYPPFAVSDNNVDAAPLCSGATALDAGTWVSGTINPGGQTTCTAQHTITRNDINATVVDNTATATAKTSSNFTITSNQASQHVLVPALLLQVTASTGISCPGSLTTPPAPCVAKLLETITYTYTMTNRTPNTISGLRIIDSNFIVPTGCPTSLLTKETKTCSGTYSGYSQARFDSGVINDQAYAIGYKISSNLATTPVGTIPSYSLLLTKTTTTPMVTVAGQTASYKYEFTNKSNVTVKTPYTVTDDKPVTISCATALTSLAPNATTSCTGTYVVTTQDLANGSIVNTAKVTATYYPTTGPVPVVSNNSSAMVITYSGPRMALTKTAKPAVYSKSGDTIEYTFTLKNTGGVDLTPTFTLSDPMFPGLSGCSATFPAKLTPGQSAECNKATLPITATEVGLNSVTNNATASAQAIVSGSPTTVNASASATINKFLCNDANLPYSPTPLGSGQDVTWTITNNTLMTIHIQAMTIQWTGPVPPTVPILQSVVVNGTTIWTGLSSSGGGFTVPGSGWALPGGDPPNTIQLHFTGTASGVRITLTFVETGCPGLDSNKAPAG